MPLLVPWSIAHQLLCPENSPEISESVLISFNSFFFTLLCFSYFHHSILQLHYLFFRFSYSAIASLQFIFISVVVLFIADCLFSIFSRSLLNIFCIFLILASILLICTFILFPRFWIFFTIITLNPGRLPLSSSFIWSCGLLLYSFTCCLFLFLFILLKLLYLGAFICRLEGHSSSKSWCLTLVGGVAPVPFERLLVGRTGACVLVGGAESCPSEG